MLKEIFFVCVLGLWRLDQFMCCLQLRIVLPFIIASQRSNAFIILYDTCFRIGICFKWIDWNNLK